jgi:3-methylcrotonyl-CoA carboxylase alpha subunit
VTITPVRDGEYRVEHDDRQYIVYVAERGDTQWAFWNGHVFREERRREESEKAPATATATPGPQRLTAPMPATVIKILVGNGQKVHKGDTVVLLEAMKMELPVRALADGIVAAVNCREGDLVQPDQVLVEL